MSQSLTTATRIGDLGHDPEPRATSAVPALLHLALPGVRPSGTCWHTACGRRVRLAGLATTRDAATCLSCRRATAPRPATRQPTTQGR